MIIYLFINCIVFFILTIILKQTKERKLYIKRIPKNLSTRNDIGNLLQNEKFESGIEVGVQCGMYADILISKWNFCKTYIMVDLWLQQKNYDDGANVRNEEQNKRFNISMNVVNKYSSRVEFIILRTSSENAAAYLSGKSFDFIYLDARHDYVSVKNDINWYYPLVKPGGIFAGHDYQDENKGEWKMDRDGNKININKAVKSAVDEFAKKNKLDIIITNEKNWKSWMIRKPQII